MKGHRGKYCVGGGVRLKKRGISFSSLNDRDIHKADLPGTPLDNAPNWPPVA